MEEKENRPVAKYKSIALFFVIAILLGVFILLRFKGPPPDRLSKARIITSRPAPNFTLPGIDGKMVSLSDYEGKVVFLNIWATWCPPCKEEMPSMEKLYQKLKGEDFEILAVSIDVLGAQAVAPFMKEHKLSFPALLDPGGTVQRLYGATGIPESFIIDKNGVLVSKVIGARDWASPDTIRYLRNLIQT
jgi:peroxiredoxin